MQELEKILGEIKAASRKVVIPNMPYKYYEVVGTGTVEYIIRKHMNDSWIPVEERLPAGYERIGYNERGDKYMRRLEVAYMTDTIEYVHGYYDGYKWMDKHSNTIENVVAWKIHEPYRPERSAKE